MSESMWMANSTLLIQASAEDLLLALSASLHHALHADPEKIVKEEGYWNSTLVGETEERSGEKPRTVIVKLKVSPV